ncbi:MAG: hypothetical protein MK102_18250 [Fuerstiella sp.]|nr:hypothetical protein [Fuerstiella sp.]
MSDLLLAWLHFHHTFHEKTEIVCPECDHCRVSLDILDVYRCEICESVFTTADAVADE